MKALLTTTLLLVSLMGFSQDYGYFGKKNNISINGTGSIPLLYWYTNRSILNYKRDGSDLRQKNDPFDGGLNISFSHATSGSFALGFEYDLLFGNVKGPNHGHYFLQNDPNSSFAVYFAMKHEQLEIRTNVFMPKIEYTFRGSQLPFGINNQFGIGYSSTKVVEKDYQYEISNPYVDSTVFTPEKMMDYNDLKSIKGLTIMYAFNVRTPINKHLMINYGIRYTLNTSFSTSSAAPLYNTNNTYPSEKFDYYVPSSDVQNAVGKKRLSSTMSLNIGINYLF